MGSTTDSTGSFLTLVEISFDDGVQNFSFQGVGVNGGQWYEPYIESIDQIDRESPVDGSAYNMQDVQIGFINYNQYFTRRKGGTAPGKYFYNRQVKILYGLDTGGYAAMTTIWTGRIKSWYVRESGEFVIVARDFSYDRFRVPVTASMKTLTTAVFPNLPLGVEPRLVSVAYGVCDIDPNVADLTTYNLGGPIPCYRIDPNVAGKFRYVICQHVCKSVINLFVYGVMTSATNYTVSTQTYGGVSMTVADFNSDPQIASRSSELEVTASVQGITDTGLIGGTLLTHPADVLNNYLLNYTGTAAGEIDSTLFASAKSLTSSYSAMSMLCDASATHQDFIHEWAQSFLGSFFVTQAQKFGIYIKPSSSLVAATTTYTHDVEIVEDTFEVNANGYQYGNVAATLNYNWNKLCARNIYTERSSLVISNQSVTLNANITQSVDMPHVGDSTTANAVATSYSDLYVEDTEYISFEVTPDKLSSLDLNNVLGVTHWQGTGPAAGYVNVTTRIFGLIITLTPTDVHVVIRALKLHQPANKMVRPVLQGKMIRPVSNSNVWAKPYMVRPITGG